MHELSIVQALMDRVGAEARARRAKAVRVVEVQIGEMSGVEVELLERAYATFRAATACPDAELRVERVAARWGCPRCGEVIAPGAILRCPGCAVPARLLTGDEIILSRIEMEVNDV